MYGTHAEFKRCKVLDSPVRQLSHRFNTSGSFTCHCMTTDFLNSSFSILFPAFLTRDAQAGLCAYENRKTLQHYIRPIIWTRDQIVVLLVFHFVVPLVLRFFTNTNKQQQEQKNLSKRKTNCWRSLVLTYLTCEWFAYR